MRDLSCKMYLLGRNKSILFLQDRPKYASPQEAYNSFRSLLLAVRRFMNQSALCGTSHVICPLDPSIVPDLMVFR